MRILVTGRQGQVARAIAASSLAAHELVFASRPEFDLESPELIESFVSRVRPDLVISAAAYTSVDLAEDDAERADRVNAEAPAILAHAASAAGAPVIHLSTDYVFDGSGSHPWREDSPIAPLSIYGRTKARGEEAIRVEAPKTHAIVRTAWVYSPWGSNFVRTMLRLAESGHQTIRVVADQNGNPTSAHCIAQGLDAIVRHWQVEGPEKSSGTYHLAGKGDASWADFATAIFAASASAGGPSAAVEPIPGSAYPTKAARPANSRLDCTKFQATFGFETAPWRQALQKVVSELRSISGQMPASA
ncbi:dTDP-4-dehydrorhamnose reductase [Sphingopyxis sp.]|jgi:dTDP-4-dehydrorhamnose reductase|uniref:dTDP-4-dehydrorhamnose reductase n=1 Tax=Sphingopyxis sp. TaxID=1908224 RepID=UPI003F6EE88C